MSVNLFDLSGKVALVTGGSRGLGREMVLGMARAGADVIISSRKLDGCERTAREVRELGRRALPISSHAGKWNDQDALVEAAYQEFGRIDILICNAGLSPLAPSLVETSEALFDKVVDVNFKGPFRLMALVGARMAAGEGGSIITISSIGGLSPGPSTAPYSGSKAALNAITVAFALAYAPKVRVNTISPGAFATGIADHGADGNVPRMVALQRIGKPEEIVTTALYLASDHSSYTTGTNIRVDGLLLPAPAPRP